MARYAKLAAKPVPQSEPLDERQVKNNAGGFVFALDKWARLNRFLILGSDSNTYYQKAQQLTKENVECVQLCLAEDAVKTVNTIVSISASGRAPKNDPAIFALALASLYTSEAGRAYALSQLNAVCRTATHLFQFIQNRKALGGGWGRGAKRAVGSWYDDKTVGDVAYQVIKYRNREGYDHKRALQTARPFAGDDKERRALYSWIKGKEFNVKHIPDLIDAHATAMSLTDVAGASKARLLKLIEKYRLPWEAIPTEARKDADVWKAMLPHLGLTALIRNLGAMTAYGALKPLTKEIKTVVDLLTNKALLKKARIHPYNVLVARYTYELGHGVKGSLAWSPISQIVDALEEAFYMSFDNVVPTGKRTLLALDVSGSMSGAMIGGVISAAQAAAALAMVTARTESQYHIFGFANQFKRLGLTAKMSLNEVLSRTENQNFGSTDCALPMRYALDHELEVDVFHVYTDNETWAGTVHPSKALQKYRKETGIHAKLIVAGMTSTEFTIADPNDPGMLDVVGFDSAAPALMADFARG